MHCCDTGEMPAVHYEHVDTQTIGTLNDILGMFKKLFRGNGRVTLLVAGGCVQEFETQTKTPNKSKKPA